jgi:tetratricopeptide (TPR) repeat protein
VRSNREGQEPAARTPGSPGLEGRRHFFSFLRSSSSWHLGVLLLLLNACAATTPASGPSVGTRSRSGATQVEREAAEERDPALDVAHTRLQEEPLAAAEIFERSALDHQKSCEAWVNAGIAYCRAGVESRGQAIWKRATERAPQCPGPFSALAGFLLQKGDAQNAMAIANAGAKRHPLHAGVKQRVAEAQLVLEQVQEAEKTSLAVLKLDEKNAGAHLNLSRVYLAQGKVELAVLAATNALAIAPERGDIHHQLGILYLRKNERPKALIEFKRAVAADPTLVASQINLSQLLTEAADFEGALSAAEAAVARAPGDTRAQLALADAYRGVQRFKDSESVYLRILEREKSNPDALYNLAVLYLDAEIETLPMEARLEKASQAFEAFAALENVPEEDRDLARSYSIQAKRRIESEKKRKAREEKRKSKSAT